MRWNVVEDEVKAKDAEVKAKDAGEGPGLVAQALA